MFICVQPSSENVFFRVDSLYEYGAVVSKSNVNHYTQLIKKKKRKKKLEKNTNEIKEKVKC